MQLTKRGSHPKGIGQPTYSQKDDLILSNLESIVNTHHILEVTYD